MTFLETTLATNPIKEFVSITKLHPILVNFTAALIPVSVAGDLFARLLKKDEFRITAWWTMLLGAIITPFTAIAGWLFWMPDDNSKQIIHGWLFWMHDPSSKEIMTIHKWLGTSLGVLIIGLLIWRWMFRKKRQVVSVPYLIVAILFVAALVVQGTLGGHQVFSGM